MRSSIALGAAMALCVALPAAAQSTSTQSMQSGAPASQSTAASLAPGLVVKDKTGATVGRITEVKPDASGKQTATIAMGADSVSVDASALVVENGAATISASQSELRSMMKKPSPSTNTR